MGCSSSKEQRLELDAAPKTAETLAAPASAMPVPTAEVAQIAEAKAPAAEAKAAEGAAKPEKAAAESEAIEKAKIEKAKQDCADALKGGLECLQDIDKSILHAVETGTVRFIDANLIRAGKLTRCERRQELEELEAVSSERIFLTPLQAVQELSKHSRCVGFLSFAWRNRRHPDPDRRTLEAVEKALRHELCAHSGHAEWADPGCTLAQLPILHCGGLPGAHITCVFWDFMSLYQVPRTPRELEVFRAGLQAMSDGYMSPAGVTVLQMKKMPPSRWPPPPELALGLTVDHMPPATSRVELGDSVERFDSGRRAAPHAMDEAAVTRTLLAAAPMLTQDSVPLSHAPPSGGLAPPDNGLALASDNFRSVVFEEAQVAEGNAPERKDGSYHIHLDSAETLEAVKAAAEAQEGWIVYLRYHDKPYDERGWTIFESSLSTEAPSQFSYRLAIKAKLDGLPPKLIVIGEEPAAYVSSDVDQADKTSAHGLAVRYNRILRAIQTAFFTNVSDTGLVMDLFVKSLSRISGSMLEAGIVRENLLGSVYEGAPAVRTIGRRHDPPGEKDEAGKAHGPGKVRYSDGRRFVGTFAHGEKQGAGWFFMPAGYATAGWFEHDARLGEAVRLSPDRRRAWRLMDGHPKTWAPDHELDAAEVSQEEAARILAKLGLEVPPAHDYDAFLAEIAREEQERAVTNWRDAKRKSLLGRLFPGSVPQADVVVHTPVELVDAKTGEKVQTSMEALAFQGAWDVEPMADGEDEGEDSSKDEFEFETYDRNSDGFVTREEILAVEEVPVQEAIDVFFEKYDLDKDGKVSADEMAKAKEAEAEAAEAEAMVIKEARGLSDEERTQLEEEALREAEAAGLALQSTGPDDSGYHLVTKHEDSEMTPLPYSASFLVQQRGSVPLGYFATGAEAALCVATALAFMRCHTRAIASGQGGKGGKGGEDASAKVEKGGKDASGKGGKGGKDASGKGGAVGPLVYLGGFSTAAEAQSALDLAESAGLPVIPKEMARQRRAAANEAVRQAAEEAASEERQRRKSCSFRKLQSRDTLAYQGVTGPYKSKDHVYEYQTCSDARARSFGTAEEAAIWYARNEEARMEREKRERRERREKREREESERKRRARMDAALSPNEQRNWGGGCYNPEARVTMADGQTKPARAIRVGDRLAVPGGGSTVVEATTRQLPGCPKMIVRLGPSLLISAMHRVQCEGVWMAASDHPSAQPVASPTALHNLVVAGRCSVEVEGVPTSTLGQFCAGAHDYVWPTHALWASEHIVDLLRRHPQWPNVTFSSTGAGVLRMLKSEEFARAYLQAVRQPME